MYLKALDIQGFKSFPDKTVLHFGEDITAIVGPNGSGKSNISDAIRWVMGEQSAKGLRGAKMEDVIFSGTEHRKPVGFAQVTLIIDNHEHIFPNREEEEVAITRRYYRSGDSEYYINRRSVRLRDVSELLMDTGLGRDGYSIIGQGRIDEIISTRSGERREVFEEAAGISKFRYKKEDAERKLQKTEDNLLRINDKISELELQVFPLKEQAEKARRYSVLRDELRVLEVSLWLAELDEIKASAKNLYTEYQTAREQRDVFRQELDALYEENERFSLLIQEKDMEAERLRENYVNLENQAQEAAAQAAVLENEVAHNQENRKRAEQELTESESRAGGLLEQADELERRVQEIDRKTADLQQHIEELLTQARTAAEKAEKQQSEAEILRTQESTALASAADARADIAAVTAENQQLAKRLSDIAQSQEELTKNLTHTEQEYADNQKNLQSAQNQAQEMQNMIAGYALRIEDRRQKAENATDQRIHTAAALTTLENRIKLLSDMEREYEGFSRAVRVLMQTAKSFPGIHGTIAELLQVNPEYTLAIEIALGGGLQNIIVDREEDAKAAIQYLKQRNGGRATFLPLSAVHGEELRENLSREPGFVGLASRLVRFEEVYRGIFENLLGRTVIMENLDCAIALARKYRNAFRIVTLDGQIMNRGGAMTGGSVNRGTGVLSRRAELQDLQKQAKDCRERALADRREEEKLKQELSSCQSQYETAEEQRRQMENEILRLNAMRENIQNTRQSVQKNLENLAQETNALSRRVKENQQKIRTLETRQHDFAERAADCHRKIGEALRGQSEFQTRSGELAEAVAEKRSALAALSSERESTRSRCQDLRRLSIELTGDRQQKEQVIQSYQKAMQKAQITIQECRKRQTDLLSESQGLRARVTILSQEKMEMESQRTVRNKQSQEANETLLNQERTVSQLEQKLSAVDLSEKQILDKLWERYNLNHSDASAIRIELENKHRATRRTGELKREISSLGNINMAAIEEYERISQRYTYLTDQRGDVEKAKAELSGIITEITRQMTDIFSEKFKLLAENFQLVFRELFGGGRAALELEDENDVLNCGIEIKAQPPGKTLKNISLLSGGEKAFVAIALYFAILKVHPTPFCVMDEIEAALDDANVTRCARYMRNLTDKTQFIVITHRRGTMEEADVLYGVTMQEQGVSKVLVMHLNSIAQNLGIEESAPRSQELQNSREIQDDPETQNTEVFPEVSESKVQSG